MNISVVERVVAHMVDLPLRPVSRVHLRRITVSLNRVGRCVRLALEAEEHAVVGHGIPGPGKLLIHADRTIQSEIVIVEVRYGVPAIRITCKASSSVASQHVYVYAGPAGVVVPHDDEERKAPQDRKSTRLNSSHGYISYAVFCLKKYLQHCHQSLWKEGNPLFHDESGYAGLSDTARHYIGGILHHAPSLLAFTNPTATSYKRLVT